MRDQLHAQNLAREFGGFVGGLGQLHASAFAASASVDLRFYNNAFGSRREQPLCGFERFIFGDGHLAARNCDAIFREDALSLILVNFHVTEKEEGTLCVPTT